MIEYNARKRAAQMRGLGATFAAAKAATRGEPTSGAEVMQSSGKAGANHEGSELQTLDNGETVDMAVDGLPPGVRKLRPASKGPWLKDDMVAYIRNAYPGVEMSEPAALTAIREAGQGKMRGRGR